MCTSTLSSHQQCLDSILIMRTSALPVTVPFKPLIYLRCYTSVRTLGHPSVRTFIPFLKQRCWKFSVCGLKEFHCPVNECLECRPSLPFNFIMNFWKEKKIAIGDVGWSGRLVKAGILGMFIRLKILDWRRWWPLCKRVLSYDAILKAIPITWYFFFRKKITNTTVLYKFTINDSLNVYNNKSR